jgi:hypothetical protein
MMHITKSTDGYDMFFIGQSYDGRKLDYFYKEFATLDIRSSGGWTFDHFSAVEILVSYNTDPDTFSDRMKIWNMKLSASKINKNFILKLFFFVLHTDKKLTAEK